VRPIEGAAAPPAEPGERVRAIVTQVVRALGLNAAVSVEETTEEIRAVVEGGDELGVMIGRRGATIDALQHVAGRAVAHGGGERKRVVVDAAGYRERREAILRRTADRAAEDALAGRRPVELEPMTAAERRVVHLYLRERVDIETHSEGDEPERRLILSPVGAKPVV